VILRLYVVRNEKLTFELVHGQCINYSFKCCDIVDYPVWAITASTVDTTTCVTLDVIYSQNTNWTKVKRTYSNFIKILMEILLYSIGLSRCFC